MVHDLLCYCPLARFVVVHGGGKQIQFDLILDKSQKNNKITK